MRSVARTGKALVVVSSIATMLVIGSAPAFALAPDAPAQPTVAGGNAKIIVTFSAPADGGSPITGYTAACTDSSTTTTTTGTSSPLTVTGLDNTHLYTCTVTATNLDGTSPASTASVPVTPSTVPDAPAQPTVAAGNAQITVTFSAPADGGSPITGYRADCTSSDGGALGTLSDTVSPITVTGLSNGHLYTCTVRATNSNGPSATSPASSAIRPGSVPDAPAQPTVAAGNAQITVTFSPPADGGSPITGYTAGCTSSDGGTPGAQGGTGSPITVTGLDNGHLYTCTVTATNSNGPSAPSPASSAIRPGSVPDAPAQPTVVAGDAQITVTFSPPADGGSPITGYTAGCTSSDGGTPGTQSGIGSPITVTGLGNGHLYTCTVTATNTNGPSAPSPASSAITPSTVPGAPAQPTVAAGDAQITVTFSPPADGGSPITGYTAQCVSSNGGVTGSATGAGSPIIVTGLDNTHLYTCTVTATNSNGPGTSSPASSPITPGTPSTVPDAPAQPTVAAGDAQIIVTFSPPADGGSPITSYTADCTSGDGGTPGTDADTGSPITVTGLDNAHLYTCTVTATNSNGPSAPSPASSATTPSTVPGAPAQPTVAAGDAQITVTFSPPADGGSPITGYTAACTDSSTTTTATGTSSPLTVTGLDNTHLYTCTVTATNTNGPSAPSPASNTITPGSVPDAPAQPTVAAGNMQITVTFSPPADGGSPITGYTAQCVSSNGGVTGSATGAGSPIIVTGLDNTHLYTCTVTATNSNGPGTSSPASSAITPHTIPGAPTKPSVHAGSARATVSFTPPTNGGSPITGYTARCVSSNGGVTGSASRSGSPITVGSLTNARTYTCTVRARNSNGFGPSSPASASFIPVAIAHGFRLFTGDGGVFTFGSAQYYGSARGRTFARVIGMVSTPSGHGYWLVATDGHVFAFGDAHSYGFPKHLNAPIVGMTATWTGRGYWLVASDGGIFAYGDAHFYGSAGNLRLRQPIVGMVATPSGHGYWMAARDGGIFNYGDAHFYGSAVGRGSEPIVGIATTLTGNGYWLAGSAGAVYTFGAAKNLGSAKSFSLRLPIRGITTTPSGRGYWLAAGDGSVFAFGDAPWYGWSARIRLVQTIRGVSR